MPFSQLPFSELRAMHEIVFKSQYSVFAHAHTPLKQVKPALTRPDKKKILNFKIVKLISLVKTKDPLFILYFIFLNIEKV